MEQKTTIATLLAIQQALQAPKSRKNDFGKYKYRSSEDIIAALKPLLRANNCALVLTDAIEFLGERYYIKATATLYTSDGGSISSTAYAREADKQGGMSDGQITGATSSYARKYALCGLLSIDGGEDLDSFPTHRPAPQKKSAAANDFSITDNDNLLL